jgi:hypothetical protein
MDQRTVPSPRLMPLPPEHSPNLRIEGAVRGDAQNLGFIPNSILIAYAPAVWVARRGKYMDREESLANWIERRPICECPRIRR